MPEVFMSAQVPAGISSPPFLNDADGQQCVQFTGTVPTEIRISANNNTQLNFSNNWRNLACQFTEFGSQFGMPPFVTITRAVVGAGTTGFGMVAHDVSGPATIHARIEYGITGPLCQHGTQPKVGTPPSWVWDAAQIASVLGPLGAAAAAGWMVGFWGQQQFADRLCSQLPPPVPTLSQLSQQAPTETLFQLLTAAAWPLYCQCTPGTPDPVGPPPPVIVLPPNIPVRPSPACDPAQLCASLVQILQELHALESVVGQLRTYVTTLQRHGVPFATIRGRVTPNLSGSGTMAVDRIVGLQAAVTAKPAGLVEFTGAPTYISDLGWLSALTGDGLIDEIRLTRDVQAWSSKILPLASQVGWALRDGVTITLTELLAEP